MYACFSMPHNRDRGKLLFIILNSYTPKAQNIPTRIRAQIRARFHRKIDK